MLSAVVFVVAAPQQHQMKRKSIHYLHFPLLVASSQTPLYELRLLPLVEQMARAIQFHLQIC